LALDKLLDFYNLIKINSKIKVLIDIAKIEFVVALYYLKAKDPPNSSKIKLRIS